MIILICRALDCKLKGIVNPTKKEFPYRDYQEKKSNNKKEVGFM